MGANKERVNKVRKTNNRKKSRENSRNLRALGGCKSIKFNPMITFTFNKILFLAKIREYETILPVFRPCPDHVCHLLCSPFKGHHLYVRIANRYSVQAWAGTG